MKCKYTLYVDHQKAYESNSIKVIKERAEFELDVCKGFFAEIMRGNKLYASRFYNTKWH